MELVPIAYRHDDIDLTGYLADGSKGRPAPGILIAHEGGGLSRHTKERARRLGERGYVAFALDMYGEEDRPWIQGRLRRFGAPEPQSPSGWAGKRENF